MKKLRKLEYGVIELHSNEALRNDWYAMLEGTKGFTVDVYVMDIAAVLKKHGYLMRVYKLPEAAKGER
jgi:hypothetical protein